jgi:hypothetical protein
MSLNPEACTTVDSTAASGRRPTLAHGPAPDKARRHAKTDNYYYEPLYPDSPQGKIFGAEPILGIFISDLCSQSN